ncbi:MAG: hypothetical protein CMJ19_02800 [Phycisphaeraceae bacterium]|nr:hypothetical protein [Phycisphaeraceae bacterium]
MKKQVLYLTVSRYWFDLIAQGIKKSDFRDMSVYWYRKLWNDIGDPRHYDEVVIRNGYSAISPTIRLEYEGVKLTHAQTMVNYPDGTILIPGSSYRIGLGNILEIKNWHGPLIHPKKKRPVFLKDIVRK